MPLIRRSLSAMVVAGALVAAPMCAMPAVHAADAVAPVASVSTVPSQHAMSVDGVALTVTNPDMPTGASFAPKPGDPVQSASAEAAGPFRFFSVTAVPFGEQLPKSDFPVAAAGGAAAWRSVEGPSTPGPVATLFGQTVTGQVRHETDGTSKIQTVQWIVEAGQRIWIVRAEHAEPDVPAGFGTDITLTASNLAAPTTVDVAAANAGSNPHAATKAVTAAASGDPVISFGGTLPPPPSSYWNHGGGTCDGGYYSLLNEKIDGLQVCGYSNGNDRTTGWGSNEWECAELPMRYAIQRWGLTGNDGGDGKDQADNLTAALNQIHPGRFVLRGNSLSDHTAPQPGDVIAYYNSGAGHTGIVIASHVDANGNGTIDMVHENWNEVASTPGEWDGIPVSNGMVENVLGGSGDVHWMHDTTSDIRPTVSAPSGLSTTSPISGTVTVTGSASPAPTEYYLHLRPAGGGADIVPHPAIQGGPTFRYQFDTTGASDSPALTIPDGSYQAFIGANYNGNEVDGPAVSITISNVPATPTVIAPAGALTGSVTLTASGLSANTTKVEYDVDGHAVGTSTAGGAFPQNIDTTTIPDGTHSLTAVAFNASGARSGTSSPLSISVWNGMLVQRHPDGTLWQYTGTPMTGWAKIDTNTDTTQVVASASKIYQFHANNSTVWQYTGTPGTWTPIDNNTSTTQIAAGGAGLFQMHNDGSVWSYTGSGTSWTPLDTNASTVALAIGNTAYQLHNDGSIWSYTGSGTTWAPLDDNSMTVEIAAGGNNLYQLHRDGTLWSYNGTPNSWTLIDSNTDIADIKVAGNGQVYQTHYDGSVWSYTGSGTVWTPLDSNLNTAGIQTGADGMLYQTHNDGSLWQYTGTGTSWTMIDNDSGTSMVNGGESSSASWRTKPLYELHTDGTLWQYPGTPGVGWIKVDDNPTTTQIASSATGLYQLHNDGSTDAYGGIPLAGWTQTDKNTNTSQILAGSAGMFELHADEGTLWAYNGTPNNWTKIDTDPGTVGAVVANNVYQLHKDGTIWVYNGAPNSWTRLDNNPNTVEIAAGGNNLYQLHNDGSLWSYNSTSNSWTQIDADANITDIKVGGNGQLFQTHKDGTVWSYNGAPNSWTQLDNNPNTTGIQAGADGALYEMHNDGSVWQYPGTPGVGWILLDTNTGISALSAGISSSVHL
ncbi:hypothetical protein KGQ19_15445 [Catenulispora sp. NL8]|uniref:Peptidase C51 domain-containing protein n=1 Tax=Catenulispora pinistramenti TaxID=2705254 RepID=A0ABS5KQH7_9ACTN|nr:hypothetical protein [Catenulispora pinistramenti]MBS2548259.1 hypothetical protein [Catenulispora pinistramenti]